LRLTKTFPHARFPSSAISDALDELTKLNAQAVAQTKAKHDNEQVDKRLSTPYRPGSTFESFSTSHGNESWKFDNLAEWYSSYDRWADSGSLYVGQDSYSLEIAFDSADTSVKVEAPSNEQVARLIRIFNLAEVASQIPLSVTAEPHEPPIVVFIGHGRSSDWRDIKDHLRDSHHYTIEAYEVGARAGHSIRDVLDSMLRASSFALLVMTAEDETIDGDARARQNVVHETGLFQGKLGFNRAIAVVENGVEVFSNLDGVQQIRYDKGNIKSTFGEILATLRREFGDRR
jgi:predicted nucleotide-binding protein